jgi:putative SOS response-associated peptidase YedK
MPGGAPYSLAGLYSEWRPRQTDSHPPLDTFSIVTAEANELIDSIHNRMPVILHRRDYDRWLERKDVVFWWSICGELYGETWCLVTTFFG